jgi:hypothetical protein
MEFDNQAAEDYAKKYGQIVARAWSDDEFKQRFLSDPASVMSESGLPVPEGVEIRAVETTDEVLYLTLPAKPAEDMVSDEELATVAGGGSTVGCAGSGGTVSSASCPVGTVGSIGSAGTAGTG